jgi:hypothetical protein
MQIDVTELTLSPPKENSITKVQAALFFILLALEPACVHSFARLLSPMAVQSRNIQLKTYSIDYLF